MYFHLRSNLRSATSTADCALYCSLAAKPVSIQKSRRMVKTKPLLVASRYAAKSFYPLTSFYTVICLDIEWLFSMQYLKHL